MARLENKERETEMDREEYMNSLEDEDVEVNMEELGIEGYKQYIRFNIMSTMFSALVSIILTLGITYIIKLTGNDKLAWLYLLPVVSYIFS